MVHETDAGEATVFGRRLPASSMSVSSVVFRSAVAILALVSLAVLLAYFQPVISVKYLILYIVAAVATEIVLSVRIGPGAHYSTTATFIFAYFILAGAIAAALLQGIVVFAVWGIQRWLRGVRQTPFYTFFNAGHYVLAVLIAGYAVRMLLDIPALRSMVAQRPIPSLLIFSTTYLGVGLALTAIALGVRSGFSELLQPFWRATAQWRTISAVNALAFALIVVLLAPSIGYVWATIFIFALLLGISWVVRLNVELRRGNEELKAINRIGGLLNSTLDLSQLFPILARESRRVLPWDGFFIALGEKQSKEIQLIFMTGAGNEIAQRRLPRGAGLTGKAIATGELMYYERDEQEAQTEEEDTIRGVRRPRSIIVAPMKFGDQVIGAISVQSFQPESYTRSHFRLLQTIASQAANAIRNAQLFASEERARVERDEFLSLVTHEIKSPLTSIKGYATIAEESARGNDEKMALESIGVIRTEAERILRLAEDLLDASRMEAGKFTVQIGEVDLASVVQRIVQKYRATARQEIDVQIGGELPRVRGDEVRLTQVVENLVSNAIKYSPEGERIDVGLSANDHVVRMQVHDHGVGIPPEKIPLVFERFYRVEENGHEVKGTGLGLFITQQIVRMHQGRIDVQSRVGEGSTFTVELPAAETPGTRAS